MKRFFILVSAVVVVVAVVARAIIYTQWDKAVPILAMAINYVRYMSAPPGTMTTEVAATAKEGASSPAPAPAAAPSLSASPGTEEGWPSYNKTLTSNRFSQLAQINKGNVGNLKVLCTYDTGQFTGFTTGLIEVNGALIGTTEYDIFSLDPANCHENWRTHEDYTPATPQGVNRGAAYMDGQLFRGTRDGRVLAYDFKTGKTPVGDGCRRSEERRNHTRCSNCVERPGVHRQCGRRH
jgi:alcohol dehydrogenase (cytochrome c)